MRSICYLLWDRRLLHDFDRLLNGAGNVKPTSILPIGLKSSYAERLSSFVELLNDNTVTKVIFNAQLALLPFLRSDMPMPVSPAGIFDPKVAAWVTETDVPEAQIELTALMGRTQCRCVACILARVACIFARVAILTRSRMFFFSPRRMTGNTSLAVHVPALLQPGPSSFRHPRHVPRSHRC